jgi:hypothetical protein
MIDRLKKRRIRVVAELLCSKVDVADRQLSVPLWNA